MSMSLSMGTGDGGNLDYMGEVLQNVFRFLDSGFSLSLTLYDTINKVSIGGSTMFSNINGRWHLRSESLPGDLAISAIAIEKSMLFMETSPFDASVFQRLMEETGMPFHYDESRREIFDRNNVVLMIISKPEVIRVGDDAMPPRCLCRLPLVNCTPFTRWQIVMLVDQMFTKGVFIAPDESRSNAGAAAQELRLELNMNLIQALELVQRPLLSLKMENRAELNTSMQMDRVQALLMLQRQVLNMSHEELLVFTAEQVAKHGEVYVLQIFTFILAGKIKKIRPTLTWKKAREVARKIMPS